MKRLLTCFFVISVFFISCQKEIDPLDPDPDPVDTTASVFDSCRIRTAYYYGGSGGINDTANFIYSNGRLVRIEGEYDKNVVYHYSGNHVVSMEYFQDSNVLYRVDSLFYLNDTMLLKMISHNYDSFFQDTVHASIFFNYAGTRLESLLTVESSPGIPDEDSLTTQLHYTGENITMLTMAGGGWADDTIRYQYDAQPNYFRNLSEFFFLADPFFQLHAGFEPHLPYFLSRNNVTQFTIYANEDYPVGYQLDSLNHPVMVTQGGFDYMGYKYECP